MSGLYNMVMGRSPVFPTLMALVGIDGENREQMGRIRDTWISRDGKTIGILHRNYGEIGQAANDAAAALPTFRALEPCSDPTYAVWLFDIPKEMKQAAIEMLVKMADNTPCWDRFMQAAEDMKAGKKTPQVERMMEVGRSIADSIQKSMDDGEDRTVETEDGAIDIITPGEGRPHVPEEKK